VSEATVLLEQATPLPWRLRRSIHGPKYRHVQIGRDESYTTLDLEPADARLIVHAVNRLPDYEAAVDALERLVGWNEPMCQRARSLEGHDRECPVDEARAALARLRGTP